MTIGEAAAWPAAGRSRLLAAGRGAKAEVAAGVACEGTRHKERVARWTSLPGSRLNRPVSPPVQLLLASSSPLLSAPDK